MRHGWLLLCSAMVGIGELAVAATPSTEAPSVAPPSTPTEASATGQPPVSEPPQPDEASEPSKLPGQLVLRSPPRSDLRWWVRVDRIKVALHEFDQPMELEPGSHEIATVVALTREEVGSLESRLFAPTFLQPAMGVYEDKEFFTTRQTVVICSGETTEIPIVLPVFERNASFWIAGAVLMGVGGAALIGGAVGVGVAGGNAHDGTAPAIVALGGIGTLVVGLPFLIYGLVDKELVYPDEQPVERFESRQKLSVFLPEQLDIGPLGFDALWRF